MMIAALAHSHGSTCSRRATGCVLERAGITVATGYNGSPAGLEHCIDEGCLMHDGHCINCEHAESNACLQCNGHADTAYCTDKPCLKCFRALLQKGVTRIYYWRDYVDPARDAFFAHHEDSLPAGIFYHVGTEGYFSAQPALENFDNVLRNFL